MPMVTVYTKHPCGWCRRVKQLLDAKGVAYDEVDVSADERRAEEMVRRSGRMTAPQVFVGEAYLGDARRLAELDARGQLDPLLAAARNGAKVGEDQR